jgi:hypothetical protein
MRCEPAASLRNGLLEELGKHQETAKELDRVRAEEHKLTQRCDSQAQILRGKASR